MTGASIRIDSADLDWDATLGVLRAIQARAVDLTGLMDEMGAHLETATAQHFEAERAPDGNPWPKSMRALAQGGQTLTKTARLRQSITRRTSAHAVEIGTNVVYAAIHQFGGEIKKEAGTVTVYRWVRGDMSRFDDWRFVKRNSGRANFEERLNVAAHTVTMPARPFLGVGPSDLTALREIARDWLRDATGGLAQ